MIVKDVVETDTVNYKKTSMFIIFPKCNFKCDILNKCKVCQNSHLAKEPDIEVDIFELARKYIMNDLTEAIVCGGLEPLDSFKDVLLFIWTLRVFFQCDDDVVIYTGYDKDEIDDKIKRLQEFKNIIIKFGGFIMNKPSRYDDVLGVTLASDNQYAERIS